VAYDLPLRYPFPLINEEKKFIMFWMPKCGCTTASYWFIGTLGLHKELDEMYPGTDLGAKVHRYRDQILLQNYNTGEEADALLATLEKPEYFKFVIVRNPFSRLVSSYFGLMNNPVLLDQLISDGLPVSDLKKKVSFSQFVEYLFTVDLSNCDPHLRYQTTNICWDNNFALDYIIRLEQLKDGINFINKKFDLDIRLKALYVMKKFLPPKNSCYAQWSFDKIMELRNSKGLPFYKNFYTPELQKKVLTLFRADIDKLEYRFDDN